MTKFFSFLELHSSLLYIATAQRITFPSVTFATSQNLWKFIKRNRKHIIKTSATIPKGGPVPPDHATVAYNPVPRHLEVDVWQKRGQDRKSPILWHENWQMQKDARKRALCTFHGDLRSRLTCLRFNGFLPIELKQLADQEICWLPKQSCRNGVKNRCMFTSRPRSNKRKWRISRMMFRQFADHGQMSGIKRAMW